MDELDKQGGIVSAVAEGRVQAAVNAQAYEMEKKIQTGEVKKVGVNIFEEEEAERQVEFHPYREGEAKKQIDRLNRIRRERDADAVKQTLDRVRTAARAGDNVMPAVMDAVEAYASVGEVCGVLKEVFGKYQEPVRF
jgi:methylmalonyl-CoA mutase N-terminal domain/subunit